MDCGNNEEEELSSFIKKSSPVKNDANESLTCRICGIKPGMFQMRNSSDFPHDAYENPWRGIRITYNASQITSNVVRPSSRTSSCRCSPTNEFQDNPAENGPSTVLDHLEMSNIHKDQSKQSSASGASSNVPVSPTHINLDSADEIPNGIRALLMNTDSEAAVAFSKLGTDDITEPIPPLQPSSDLELPELQKLMDSKFQIHLQKLKENSCISDLKKSRLADIVAEQKLEPIVKEVPLADIELGSLHLKVN